MVRTDRIAYMKYKRDFEQIIEVACDVALQGIDVSTSKFGAETTAEHLKAKEDC